jgi:hypothetical protein
MVQEVKNFIDSNTVSQTFMGAKEEGGKATATQIIELQRQARIMMGLMVLAASLLEKKLATKRLMILLRYWFNPIDERVDQARQILRNRYRIVSIARNIEGEGPGMRMVLPSEEKVTPTEVMMAEDRMKEMMGMPTRILVLNPRELKTAQITWVVTVNAKEKKSSELSKLLFGAMVTDGINLGLRFNPDHIEERFAQVWDEDPMKLFTRQPSVAPVPMTPSPQGTPRTPGASGTPLAGPRISPQVKIPNQQNNILM